MPLSFPKGILYITLDDESISTNNKTGLPTAVGNMPNIPAMQNGPFIGNQAPYKPIGPYTTFFVGQSGKATLNINYDVVGKGSKIQGNFVDENGEYLPTKGSFLDIAKNNPLKVDSNALLQQLGNPGNATLNNKQDLGALERSQGAAKTGVGYKLISYPTTPATLIINKMSIFNAFLDYSGKQFTHGLDYLQGGISTKSFLTDSKNITNLSGDIYMGSFKTTRIVNEDPTYLGYDIVIKTQTSPLFNGELLNFLQRYAGYTELGSRISVYDDFILHLRKFMNYDEAKVGEIMVTDKGRIKASPINTYYLTKLSGLKNLVEKTQSEGAKYFPDYPKDKISLTFREDVTQSIGYLASLYKTLSWSRINGKQIIPENLLRFDCDIIVSEVRKFNRIAEEIKYDPNALGLGPNFEEKIKIFKDNISRYVYTLYECQFYFDEMPHGDDLDMSNPQMVDSYSIDINYKFSTMRFEKFEYSIDRREFDKKVLDNSITRVTDPKSSDPDATFIQELGEIKIESAKIQPYDTKPNITIDSESLDLFKYQPKRPTIPEVKTPIGTALPFTNLKKDIKQAFVNEINRQISKQVGLIFKTIENLRRQIPFAGQLDEPTNVYSGRSQFENDLVNAGRNFVGSSLRGLFGNQSVKGNLPRRR
jgi:hypothetical protein